MQYFMVSSLYIFVSFILVGPIQYTNVYAINSQEEYTSSFNIVQTIVTIITTVIALFFANYLLDWKRHRQTKPILTINPDENPSTYENNVPIPVYKIKTPLLIPRFAKLSGYDLNYKINRIKVRNNGNSAADDCKGIIIQNDIEMKISWNVPTERHKMTINAKSYEYLDICAVLIGDRKEIVNDFNGVLNSVSKLIESHRESRVSFEERQELDRVEYDFFKRFSKAEDTMNEFIPYIIAPTENDWQQPAFNNRKLKAGKARVKITSKNATPIEYDLTILETPQDGKIIKVNDAVKVEY